MATTGMAAIFLSSVTLNQTQTAIANGDTRTISLIHIHTKEEITATFRSNGQYDSAVLEKLNWFLRDWRRDEPIKMDPRLFDIVWETYRESGSREPIIVMSAYRSPQTNAMLRRRSRAVAEHSQHILGKAMDMHYTDVSMARIREIGMRLQKGGVGYYPTAGSPFVHLDAGNVRSWPRMANDQLARLFPDGKTVHIPANGQPMARYEEARAEIERSGSGYVPVSSVGKSKSFFAALFGGGEDDDGPAPAIGQKGRRQGGAGQRSAPQVVATTDINGDSRNFFVQEAQRVASLNSDPVAQRPLSARNAKPLPATKPAPEPVVAAVPVQPPLAEPKSQIPAKLVLPPQPADPALAPDDTTLIVASLPLPPRRPNALLAAYAVADVPLPPVRPVDMATRTGSIAVADAKDGMSRLIASNAAAPALPDVILRGGPAAGKPVPLDALGYAETPIAAAPPSRPVIGAKSAPAVVVAALVKPATARVDAVLQRVDKTNMRGLIAASVSAQTLSPSVIGAAAPALRSFRRAQAIAFFADPVPGIAGRFEVAATVLPTDRFVLQ